MGARGREGPCRGARSRLINGPQVTAIKLACQWRGSEAFSAMIQEPASLLLSAPPSTAALHVDYLKPSARVRVSRLIYNVET